MKILKQTLLLTISIVGIAVARESSIAGTWQGKLHDLPAITLSVTDEGGNLSGTILFYLLRYDGQAWTVDKEGSVPLPLIDPKLDGKLFSFKVSHREAHPPETLNDPPVVFEMRLTGTNQAELKNMSEDQDDSVKMLREE